MRADPGRCSAHAEAVFRQLQEQGADFLLTVKANQRTLHRQVRSQFQGKRRIPFVATDHEVGQGREITWALRAKQAPEHIREAWIGTSWMVEVAATGTRDTQRHEDAHRYCGNGAGALAALRTAAMNVLRLAGFQSIRSGMQAVMHDIKALLAMVRPRPAMNLC